MTIQRQIKLFGGHFDSATYVWHGESIFLMRKPNYAAMGVTDDGGPEVLAAAIARNNIIEQTYRVRSMSVGGYSFFYASPADWTDRQTCSLIFGEAAEL